MKIGAGLAKMELQIGQHESGTTFSFYPQQLRDDAWALKDPFRARKTLARGFNAQIFLPVSDCDEEYFMEMCLCCMQP